MFGVGGPDEPRFSETEFHLLRMRVDALEQALCGVCQIFAKKREPVPAVLLAWFTAHLMTTGCAGHTSAPENESIIDLN